jgi:hypothetical protein
MIPAPEEKKTLWAVVVEQWAPHLNVWVPYGLEYVHAVDEQNAKIEYIRSNPMLGKKILCVGRPIGYHVLDNQGLILAV